MLHKECWRPISSWTWWLKIINYMTVLAILGVVSAVCKQTLTQVKKKTKKNTQAGWLIPEWFSQVECSLRLGN